MGDWYVSSQAWAAVPQWAASHAYVVGNVVRPLTAPAVGKAHVFRVTTAGTSTTEPTWPTANNATVTAGCTFTNVSGQSTYGWSAAAGDLYSISQGAGWNRPVVGDRVFLSSDHSESMTSAGSFIYSFNGGTSAFGLIQIISVNRGGSVPPGSGDILSGAAIVFTPTSLGIMGLDPICDMFWQGITFTATGAVTSNIYLAYTTNKSHYFKNCAFVLSTASVVRISNNAATAKVVFDNTTVSFGNVGGYIGGANNWTFDFTWINTLSAIQGSIIPNSLFVTANGANLIVCRGVDLSAITTTLLTTSNAAGPNNRALLDSCRIASGVVRLSAPAAASPIGDEIELINCFDGANVVNERHTTVGDVTMDRGTTLSGGASDYNGAYSLKPVSSARSDFAVMPLDSFWMDVENTLTGSPRTATVEIVSSSSLNNNDIRLLLEYMGTAGSSVASFVDSLPSVLTAASALPTSSKTWNNPPATPVKQYLQVTFTPQTAGRVRGLVRLGKVSTTVWFNPQVTIT